MPVTKLINETRVLHDVDFVVVNNETGDVCQPFLSFLRDNRDKIADCAAITGRNEGALLRMFRKLESKEQTLDWNRWKNNRLSEVDKKICLALEKNQGEHVFCITDDIFHNKEPGYHYRSIYRERENEVLECDSLSDARRKQGLNNPKINQHEEAFLLSISANWDNFNKGAQVEYYLRNSNENLTTLYMDDEPDNVLAVAKKNPEVISFLFNMEMNDGYNKQALDLAIKAANARGEEREKICKDLIRAAIEFKTFHGAKEVSSTRDDLIKLVVKDNSIIDWFEVLRGNLSDNQKEIVKKEFQEAIVLRESNAQWARREKEKQASSEINAYLDANNDQPSQGPHSSPVSASSLRSFSGSKRLEEKKILPESDCDKVIIGLTALAIGGVAVGCASALGVGLVVAVPVGAVVAVAVAVGAFAVIELPKTSPEKPEGHQFSSLQNIFSFCNNKN